MRVIVIVLYVAAFWVEKWLGHQGRDQQVEIL